MCHALRMGQAKKRIEKWPTSLGVCLLLTWCAGGASAVQMVPPSLGTGVTPDMEDCLSLSISGQIVDIFSYAFIGSGGVDPAPASMPDPSVGETLYVYVIKMGDFVPEWDESVMQFDVANPYKVLIDDFDVSYDNSVVPDGFTGNRQNPGDWDSDPNAQSVSWFYNYIDSNMNPLDPASPAGEYGVVYFSAMAPPGYVLGTVAGTGLDFDEGMVIGPVPEPAVGAMVLLGALLILARRRYPGRRPSLVRALSARRGWRLMSFLTMLAILTAVPSQLLAADLLGGDATAELSAIFSRTNKPGMGTWQVQVDSFAYAYGDVLPPGISVAPNVNEMLFVYLLQNLGNGADPLNPLATDTAVVSFSVLNPPEAAHSGMPAPIISQGPLTGATASPLLVTGPVKDPAGWATNPYNVDFNWKSTLNPADFILDVNEFSLVYFIAESTYTERPALVTGAAQSDSKYLLGPTMPEPASLGLLALGGLALMKPRRRR